MIQLKQAMRNCAWVSMISLTATLTVGSTVYATQYLYDTLKSEAIDYSDMIMDTAPRWCDVLVADNIITDEVIHVCFGHIPFEDYYNDE